MRDLTTTVVDTSRCRLQSVLHRLRTTGTPGGAGQVLVASPPTRLAAFVASLRIVSRSTRRWVSKLYFLTRKNIETRIVCVDNEPCK